MFTFVHLLLVVGTCEHVHVAGLVLFIYRIYIFIYK